MAGALDHLQTDCKNCGNGYLATSATCPHCGERGAFPNVLLAEAEAAVLQDRYQNALQTAREQGVEELFLLVKPQVEQEGRVCINRSFLEVLYWLEKGGVYNNFWRGIEAGTRFPEPNEWDRLRELVDALLFPYFKKEINFAALYLNDEGMDYYGPCTLILDEKLIINRTTLFEENTILFCKKHGSLANGEVAAGYRATWQDRGKLAACKVVKDLEPSTSLMDLPTLLMRQDPLKNGKDAFIEVHIYGQLTVKSIVRVSYSTPAASRNRKLMEAMEEMLQEKGVTHTVRR